MQKQDYKINKVYTDDYGRPSGVFVAYKPEGVSSHDIVYEFRRKLGTKKVGHAGALDLYAKGILIILAGKATKLSDRFLEEDKEYLITVLLGIGTDSGDIEGEILNNVILSEVDGAKSKIEDILKSFQPEYQQFVPVFSSVKVGGKKLRELARSSEKFEIVDDAKNRTKYVDFTKKDGAVFRINLPSKVVKIYKLQLLDEIDIPLNDLIKILNKKEEKIKKADFKDGQKSFQAVRILIRCSKGTYVRQLAIDIGEKLGVPTMIIELERTAVGDFTKDNIYQ